MLPAKSPAAARDPLPGHLGDGREHLVELRLRSAEASREQQATRRNFEPKEWTIKVANSVPYISFRHAVRGADS